MQDTVVHILGTIRLSGTVKDDWLAQPPVLTSIMSHMNNPMPEGLSWKYIAHFEEDKQEYTVGTILVLGGIMVSKRTSFDLIMSIRAWFEEVLRELDNVLPLGEHFKHSMNCRVATFVGYDGNGTMVCFDGDNWRSV